MPLPSVGWYNKGPSSTMTREAVGFSETCKFLSGHTASVFLFVFRQEIFKLSNVSLCLVGCDTELLGFSLSRIILQRNMLRQFVCSSLQMAVVCSSKTLASACHTSQCHIPAEPYLNSKRHMYIRSRM